MHIADGFISQPACVVTTGLAAASLVWAVKNARVSSSADQLKLAPAVAAAVFAGQMVNFAMGSGMSGHFVGSALAAILLGPALGVVVMAVVLAAQCAFLGDGGVTALGANILSMGVVGVLASHFIWQELRKHQGNWIAIGIASWTSVLASSIVCTAALVTSGIAFEMLANHTLVGLAEAAVTVAVVVALQSLSSVRGKFGALMLATACLFVVSPLSSTLPDGLEAAVSGSNGIGYLAAGLIAPFPLVLIARAALIGSREAKVRRIRVRR